MVINLLLVFRIYLIEKGANKNEKEIINETDNSVKKDTQNILNKIRELFKDKKNIAILSKVDVSFYCINDSQQTFIKKLIVHLICIILSYSLSFSVCIIFKCEKSPSSYIIPFSIHFITYLIFSIVLAGKLFISNHLKSSHFSFSIILGVPLNP